MKLNFPLHMSGEASIQATSRFHGSESGSLGHRHGGDPLSDMKRLGISERKVLDFSVNVNPLGPPSVVSDAWPRLINEIALYPSVNGNAVVDFYQSRFGLSSDCVLPGNGSVEMIYLAPRALKIETAAVVTPTFHEYERALFLAGATVTRIPLVAENGFAPLYEGTLSNALRKHDALFVCNPNNPVGTRFDAGKLIDLSDAFPEKYLFVDEAFAQFLEDFESITLMHPSRIRKNLVVFHSLTKMYALPGLRVGCAVSHPETVAILKKQMPPWSVNRIVEAVVPLLTQCVEYETKLRTLCKVERGLFKQALAVHSGVRLFDGVADFLLGQWTKTSDLDDLLKKLLTAGLYIRDCRNFPGLEDNYFRFCIRLPSENDRLTAAILGAIDD